VYINRVEGIHVRIYEYKIMAIPQLFGGSKSCMTEKNRVGSFEGA